MKQLDFKNLNPKVVAGIAAHPDDLDFGAGGTMAGFANQGAKVHYLMLTDGSKGSKDRKLSAKELAKLREEEQREACRVIGGESVEFLGYPDAHLEVTMKLKKQIVQFIRKHKPDVVVTTNPQILFVPERGFINHPDHRAAGQAVLDAVFPLARDHLTFPELLGEGYEPHITPTILMTNFGAQGNFNVDITDTFNKKIETLKTHKSQVGDIEKAREKLKILAEDAAKEESFELAESFTRIDIGIWEKIHKK